MNTQIIIKKFSQFVDYHSCWQDMKNFTDNRTPETPDEMWILEHYPVYTQGQNGKPEHVLNAGNIPLIKTDRGGQVTFHGPGQFIFYLLIDVKRKKFNIRELVSHLENAVIQLLADYQIIATAKCNAPGVYVADKKICSVGLRIRRGCSYHGLALNVDMDLTPFTQINPCGFANLQMTQLKELIDTTDSDAIRIKLIEYLTKNLGYTTPKIMLEALYGN
jgi:lipoyl(octanoyl) transferase